MKIFTFVLFFFFTSPAFSSPYKATLADQFPGPSPVLSNDMAISRDGQIFTIGEKGGRDTTWIVRSSKDGGLTWRNLDTFVYSDGGYAVPSSIAIDPLGRVYVGGIGYDRLSRKRIILRTKSLHASAWTTHFVGEPIPADPDGGQSPWPSLTLKLDGAGNIYLWYYHESEIDGVLSGTFLFESGDKGKTWNFIFEEQVNLPLLDGLPLAIDSNGTIYAKGFGVSTGDGNYWKWQIRKSMDHGKTWNIVFDDKGNDGNIWTIRADSAGRIYAAGFTFGPTERGVTAWIRMTADGGATWQVIDESFSPEGGIGYKDLQIAQNGDLWALESSLSKNEFHWLTRHYNAQSNLWETVDDFAPTLTSVDDIGYARALSIDSKGNIFILGCVNAGWITRKISGASPRENDFRLTFSKMGRPPKYRKGLNKPAPTSTHKIHI